MTSPLSELAPETWSRLLEARERQNSYAPPAKLVRKLGQSTLIECIGISQAGKSTIMQVAESLTSTPESPIRLVRAGGASTRFARGDDDTDIYRFTDPDTPRDAAMRDALDRFEHGRVVQYFITPGDNPEAYWTEPADYASDSQRPTVFMKDIFPQGLANFERIFPRTQRVYVVRERKWSDTLIERFGSRNELTRRACEATESLEWALDQDDTTMHWLINRAAPSADNGIVLSDDAAARPEALAYIPGGAAAQELIDMVRDDFSAQDPAYTERARRIAQETLYVARSFLPFASHADLGVAIDPEFTQPNQPT